MAEVPPLILPLLSFYMPLSLPLPCSLLPAPCSHFTAIPPVSCSPPSQRKKASPAAEERVSVKMSLAQLRVTVAYSSFSTNINFRAIAEYAVSYLD
eukprot:CAMPEP_0173181398 /NCGR_PEP_ID=MMETSP1141-20130122/7260_1 /TAXON_ID=483371 /ORGANISM="non described non described, Strain CCMP2298" /LENGTH=95 /DNA_ID=CAMNT_0014104377 /DNA_START=205 /DNA_END=489 /DNA_ORIENTATION=-